MKLQVVSLKGVQYEGEAVSVNIKTTSGEITVLDNHRPMVTELAAGKAFVTKKDDEKLEFNIVSGFLEVGEDNRASLLIS